MSIFKRIFFHIYIYFMGFNFYLTEIDKDRDEYITSLSAKSNTGKDINFNFYKTSCTHNRFHFGKIKSLKNYRYGVCLELNDENFPELIKNYSNKLMTFYLPNSNLISDKSITRYLLNLYINYIIKQILEDKQNSQ